MGAYNIVNPSALVAGQSDDISQVLANFQAIATILNGGIDNSNINAAAAVALSKLAGYPADATKFARGDGTWAVPTIATAPFKKATAKTINTNVEQDLLNGELTIAANALGTTGKARILASGDLLNNSGGAVAGPRLKFKLGTTTLIDTGVIAPTGGGAGWLSSVSRGSWDIDLTIQNLGVANSQWLRWRSSLTTPGGWFASSVYFTVGQGATCLAITGAPGGAGTGSNMFSAGVASGGKDSTGALLAELTVTLPASTEFKLYEASCEYILP